MPRITILDRYVAREVLAPFGMGVALLTFALVTGKLLRLTDMVVNHGVSVVEVLGLVAFIMPAFFELTFPMAVLLGVLLGFGRMSGDREMIAARACGVSLYRIAIPVMMVAVVVYVVASWFAFSIRPWANISLEQRLFYLTRSRISAVLREKVFNAEFRGLVIYVDKVSESEGLQGVMISDARTPDQQNTIIARHGIMLPDAQQNQLTLRLFDGSIFGIDPKMEASHVTSFNTYDLAIKPDEAFGSTWLSPDEMTYATLLATIRNGRKSGKRNYEAETELARKYMIPIATLLFALLGVSLGLKPARGGQSERFGVSVALFFFYYSLMRVGQTLGERGALNAFVAMAIPDVVFLVLALWLFVRAAEDRGNEGRGPGDYVWDLIERFERSRGPA